MKKMMTMMMMKRRTMKMMKILETAKKKNTMNKTVFFQLKQISQRQAQKR
jgi:hypothetical protein